ncbi:MAG: hypothetical protein NC251_13955 [Lachnoclostridium sp.]|nr:hypothetical protein [Lachnospiraceae bacterium]MCM1249506.1 hypothetical protein [Lachnoclostridium sp.]
MKRTVIAVFCITVILMLTAIFIIRETETAENKNTEEVSIPEISVMQADKMIFKEEGYQGEPCYEFVSPQGTTVILYSDPVSYNAYAVIDGQQYLFAEESDFYVSAVIEPSILFFDGNQDGKTDIFIWANRIRFGMEQNAYLATDTGYQTWGGTTWQTDAEEHSFLFEASYCDKYSVHVTVPEYGVDSTVPLADEYFRSVAEEMGVFDINGRVTAEGKTWNSENNSLMAPLETAIECGTDREGSFILRAHAPLYAGYSDCKTGAVFVLDWKLTDTGYQLTGIYLTTDEFLN